MVRTARIEANQSRNPDTSNSGWGTKTEMTSAAKRNNCRKPKKKKKKKGERTASARMRFASGAALFIQGRLLPARSLSSAAPAVWRSLLLPFSPADRSNPSAFHFETGLFWFGSFSLIDCSHTRLISLLTPPHAAHRALQSPSPHARPASHGPPRTMPRRGPAALPAPHCR